jgi:hypothetical protein
MGERSDLARCADDLRRDIRETRRRIEGRAGSLREKATAKEMLRPVTRRLNETLGEGGGKILDAFRENPIPLTLAGIGLGWLLIRDLRRPRPAPEGPGLGEKAKEVAEGAKEAAGKVSEKVSGAAAKVKEAAKTGVRKTSSWFEGTLEDNPMLLAFGTLALGIVAGLSVPISEKEIETAGKVGEKLAKAALEKGAEAIEKAPEPAPPASTPAIPEGT